MGFSSQLQCAYGIFQSITVWIWDFPVNYSLNMGFFDQQRYWSKDNIYDEINAYDCKVGRKPVNV